MLKRKIYIWTTATYQAKGFYKIGDSSKKSEDRIKQQATGVPEEMILISEDIDLEGNPFINNDKDLHATSEFKKRHLDTKSRLHNSVNGGTEWFDFFKDGNSIEERDSAVKQYVNEVVFQSKKANTYKPLEPQAECIKKAVKHFKNKKGSDQFLMNAIMRFGKTFTTYQIIKKLKLNNVLVTTAYPDALQDAWAKDLDHVDFKNFSFRSIENIADFDKSKTNVYGASLQTFIGDGSISETELANISSTDFKDKHEQFFTEVKLDMVVIDEAHYYDSENRNKFIDFLKQDNPGLKVMYLSGTPIKLLARGDFDQNEIYNFSYQDERKWIKKVETENKKLYDQLDLKHRPEISLLRIDLNDRRIKDQMKELGYEDDEAFTAKKLFGTVDGEWEFPGMAQSFLDMMLSDKKVKEKLLPFNGGRRSKAGLTAEAFKNTMWLMPSVEAAKATAQLINEKYEGFEALAVTDDNIDQQGNKNNSSLDWVNRRLHQSDKKIIILTVGKLTTGISIKEIGACLNFSSGSSAELYWQFGFRSKTPDGMKVKSFIVDFAPERTFEVSSDLMMINKVGKDDEGNPLTEADVMDFLDCFNFYDYIDGFAPVDVNKVFTEIASISKNFGDGSAAIESIIGTVSSSFDSSIIDDVDDSSLGNTIIKVFENESKGGKTYESSTKDPKEVDEVDEKDIKNYVNKLRTIFSEVLDYVTDPLTEDYNIFSNQQAIDPELFSDIVSVSEDVLFNCILPFLDNKKVIQAMEVVKVHMDNLQKENDNI
jgi:type II restriction enzyme